MKGLLPSNCSSEETAILLEIQAHLDQLGVDLNKPLFRTVGLYADRSWKTNGVLREHLLAHIWYNINHRFGRAIFIDNILVYNGYMNYSELRRFMEDILFKLEPAKKETAPYV